MRTAVSMPAWVIEGAIGWAIGWVVGAFAGVVVEPAVGATRARASMICPNSWAVVCGPDGVCSPALSPSNNFRACGLMPWAWANASTLMLSGPWVGAMICIPPAKGTACKSPANCGAPAPTSQAAALMAMGSTSAIKASGGPDFSPSPPSAVTAGVVSAASRPSGLGSVSFASPSAWGVGAAIFCLLLTAETRSKSCPKLAFEGGVSLCVGAFSARLFNGLGGAISGGARLKVVVGDMSGWVPFK